MSYSRINSGKTSRNCELLRTIGRYAQQQDLRARSAYAIDLLISCATSRQHFQHCAKPPERVANCDPRKPASV